MSLLEEQYKNNDIQYELGRNFIEYAVAVNSDRSIPDAKSGLKPVAKRILWSAFEEGRLSSKPHVKAARIVGDVMGKYHPHGDSSIYGAMVRLSQPWTLRYPLIDWHGNNGNQMGDGPAAARYTEARLSKLAEDGLLQGMKKRNVDFILNYDETMEEPITLPAIFPNLLCNPNTGIGVAIACNWLPHNLKEVAQAIYDYIDGKEVTLPGPDFPTGGIIINKNDISEIMKTGHGSIKVRGQYKIEKNNIIFYEIPYGETVEGLMSQIGEVCDAKEIDGISEIRDESNKKGLRIVIQCQRGFDLDNIAQELYAKTNLQTSISYNQVALIDKTPTELNLKQCIEIYINHNIDCLIKEVNFDLGKAKERLHIVEGLLIALEDIDNVIALIKKSESSAAAKVALIEKYNLSDTQAKAILAMRLSSLARLEKLELENERKDLMTSITYYMAFLQDKNLQLAEVKKRLEEIVKKYGDTRRTQLMQIELPKTPSKKSVPSVKKDPVDVVVVTTHSGLIKKIPVSSFKTQSRGGVGVKTLDSTIMSVIKTNTEDIVMFFTNGGKVCKLIADKIPDGTNVAKGTPVSSLINLDKGDNVIAVTSLHNKSIPKYIIFVTKDGMIKKSLLSDYMTSSKSGNLIAIKLKENDIVKQVIFQDEEDIFIATKNGMGLRIATNDITPIGRVAMGIRGIKLGEGDEVVSALPIHKETDNLGIFYTNGYGYKRKISDIVVKTRNTKGVMMGSSEIAGIAMISDEDNLIISGNTNTICISAKDVPVHSSAVAGVILIKNNIVKSITKI